MSKYTTEVRFICEVNAGLDESVGSSSVDHVLDLAVPKIFDDDIPIFDNSYKTGLFKKILLHYYTREIAFETVGLWKLKLNMKMKEIMPYYNQLYESTLLEYDPLKNVNNTHGHQGAFNTDGNEFYMDRDTGDVTDNGNQEVLLRHAEQTHEGKRTTGINASKSRDGSTWTEFSDTPQGALDGVRASNYLTSATHVTDSPAFVGTDVSMDANDPTTFEYNPDNKGETNNDHTDKTKTTNTTTNNLTHTHDKSTDHKEGNDSYINTEMGKIGTETYQEMVMKYRETFLNIDMMIINDLSDLFFKLW